MNINNIKLDFILPVLFLAISTLLFWLFDWDIQIQQLFYNSSDGWYLKNSQPWISLYKYSNIPALIISVSSLLLLGISFFKPKLIRSRKIFLFLTMVMALGPGLFVNTLLKDNWGRPRPRSITEFGGSYNYEKPLEIDSSSKGKSFPCGHASMGFYLISFFFLFRKKKPKLAQILLLLGILTGSLIGLARIVQGGHFTSDVIWSGGIVYLVAAASFYVLGMHKQIFLRSDSKLPVKKNLMILLISCAAIILTLLLMMASPYSSQKNYKLDTSINTELLIKIARGDVRFEFGQEFNLEINVAAHGFPWSTLKTKFRKNEQQDLYQYSLKQRESGFFSEVNQTILVTIPEHCNCKATIEIADGNLIFSEKMNNIEITSNLDEGRIIELE